MYGLERGQSGRQTGMKFDTEEAFFRATFSAAGTSPTYMVEAVRLAEHEERDRDKAIRTEAVRMLRGAFTVHQRADAQLAPGDSLLSYRLSEAARELPDGWQVVVLTERGSTRVDLYDASGARYELASKAGDLSGRVSDAVETAMDAETKKAASVPVPPLNGA
jgi:hypothetical protein